MSSEILLNTIRNVVAIDRATSACSSGLQIGQSLYLSDPAAHRILKLTGLSHPQSDGRWTDGPIATLDVKLASAPVEMGRLRLHMLPFVTEDKGQSLRLRCGEGPEKTLEFSPGTLAWRIVDLPLTGVHSDTFIHIRIAVGQMFVPSKLGISPDPRALGVLIRKIELLTDAVDELLPLAPGNSINLGSPDLDHMVRLDGFSGPDPDGRWTDGTVATINLKLPPETIQKGRLRLHVMPFVTEKNGQSLQLRCGEGPEKVVEFSPGEFAWKMVDLPLAGVQSNGHTQIELKVGHTFVPLKLGMSSDPRALGVMVGQIELLSDTEPDRVDGQIGEQPKELPIQSTLEAEDLVSFAVGSSISLASP